MNRVSAALEDGFMHSRSRFGQTCLINQDMDLKDQALWRMHRVKGARQCLMKFRIILTMSVCVIGWRAHRWIGNLEAGLLHGGRSMVGLMAKDRSD